MADDTIVSLAIAARAAAAAENAALASWAGAAANVLVAVIAVASPWLAARIVSVDRRATRRQVMQLCENALVNAESKIAELDHELKSDDATKLSDHEDLPDDLPFRYGPFYVERPFVVRAMYSTAAEETASNITALQTLKMLHSVDAVSTVQIERAVALLNEAKELFELLARDLEGSRYADQRRAVSIQSMEAQFLHHEIRAFREEIAPKRRRSKR